MFKYSELEYADYKGMDIGAYKGRKVFPCRFRDLKSKGSGVFYLVYDYDYEGLYSLIIRDANDEKFYIVGKVSEKGEVTDLYKRVSLDELNYNKVSASYEVKKTETKNVPVEETVSEEPQVVGDVKLEIDVEKMLAAARDMSIDDLLKGFNYGL